MSCQRRLQVRCGGSSQLPDPGHPHHPLMQPSTSVERLFLTVDTVDWQLRATGDAFYQQSNLQHTM